MTFNVLSGDTLSVSGFCAVLYWSSDCSTLRLTATSVTWMQQDDLKHNDDAATAQCSLFPK